MIVMYSMKDCKLCCIAKKILAENHIAYLEKQFSPDKLREKGFPYFAMNGRFYEYEEFITLIADYLMFQVRRDK